MTNEDAQRALVVREALSWVGTKYHPHGRIKGVGVDCAMLLAEVYQTAGIIPRVETGYYSMQFHLHRGTELYLAEVLKHSHETNTPKPGDVAVWKFGRCFSHGAIIVQWPRIVHAFVNQGCVLEDAEKATWLKYIGENGGDHGKPRPHKFFTCW